MNTFFPAGEHGAAHADALYHESLRERYRKTDDFPMLVLSKDALKLLKKSKDGIPIRKEDIAHTRNMENFFLIQRDGDRFVITDRGTNYLLYRQEQIAKNRRDGVNRYVLALFTALAGALASDPVWDAINALTKLLTEIASQG